MYNISLTQGGHHWEKQNLVTIFDGSKNYDVMKCKNCGIVGKTSSIATIKLKGSYSHETVYNCKNSDSTIPARIKVTKCAAHGKLFGNLTDDSEHDVIEPPAGYKNDFTGVWVMGVGEPVKVLANEFIKIK